MEIKQIKELMAAMGRTGTKKISLKKEGFELEIERDGSGMMRPEVTMGALEYVEETPYQLGSSHRANAALLKGKELSAPIVPAETASQHEGALYITSPMVGTFYVAAGPDEPIFVKIGDKIDKSTVVCIIEAMKVMNEIKAGVTGTIVEILVENGSPVEFGTKLFRIS